MTTQIRTLRENVVKALSGIKEDNVSIAGIAIHRKTLLEALKLQTDDRVTIQYGKLSWEDGSWESDNYARGYITYDEHYHPQFEADPKRPYYWHDKSFAAESALQITCGRSVMRFLSRPHVKRGETTTKSIHFRDGHTELPKEVTGVPFDTRELLDALTYVLPCVAQEESRPPLRCVCFDSKGGVLTLAAADGFRLGIAKFTVKDLPDIQKASIRVEDINRLIVLLKHVKPMGRGKAKYYPEVKCAVTQNDLTFGIYDHTDTSEVTLPIQTSFHFPDYAQLIPQAGTQIEFIASDFLEAVKALASYCKDGSGIIRMEFTRDELLGRVRLSARSEDLGESSTEVDANVAADCRIAANHTYLEALLKLCGDNTITLKITRPDSPMVFETAANRTCVIMPMFVSWGQADVKPEPAEEPEEEVTEPYPGDEDGQDAEDLVESEVRE